MQRASYNLQYQTLADKQKVTPRVNVEWLNSRNIVTLNTWSSSDNYLKKTKNWYPSVFWQLNESDYEAQIITDHPFCNLYMLNDITSTALDSNVILNGSYTGGYTQSEDSILTTFSTLFNGSSGYVSVPSDIRFSPGYMTGYLSIEAWVMLASVGADQTIVGKGNVDTDRAIDNGYEWKFEITSGNLLKFSILKADGTTYISGTGSIEFEVDTWYHVVASWDSKVIRLYTNGHLDGTSKLVTEFLINTPHANTSPVNIARMPDNSDYLHGHINAVAIYNNILNPAEILGHYNLGRGNFIDGSANAKIGHYIGTGALARVADEDPYNRFLTSTRCVAQFNGVDQYIINNSVWYGGGDVSVEIWAKLADHPGDGIIQTIYLKGSSEEDSQLVDFGLDIIGTGASTEKFQVYANNLDDDTFTLDSDDTDYTGRFHHLVFTIKDQVMYLYVDGIEYASTTITGTRTGRSGPITLATDSNFSTGEHCFAGELSNFAIFDGTSGGVNGILLGPKVLARYYSALSQNGNDSKHFGPIFADADEAMNGKFGYGHPWAILGGKDEGGSNIGLCGGFDIAEDSTQTKSLKYEYGWWGKAFSQEIDSEFGFIDPYTSERISEHLIFDIGALEFNSIGVYIPTEFSGIAKYKLFVTPFGEVEFQVGDVWEMPKGADHFIHELTWPLDFNGYVLASGIRLEIISTHLLGDIAKVCEVTPLIREELSEDVISISINKVKENFDSSVPFGATAANDATIALQNTNLRYNPYQTGSLYGLFVPDVKFEVELGWLSEGGYTEGTAPGGSAALVLGFGDDFYGTPNVVSPHAAHFNIRNNIEIIAYIYPTSWTPDDTMTIVGCSDVSPELGWAFSLLANGKLRFSWSANGTSQTDKDSTVAVSATTVKWVRVLTHNTGSNADIKFYTSDDGETWVQLGTTVLAGLEIDIFPSAADLEIGSTEAGTVNFFNGRMYSMEIRNRSYSLDPDVYFIVADPNFVTDPRNWLCQFYNDGGGATFGPDFYDHVNNGYRVDPNNYPFNPSIGFEQGGIEYIKQGTFYADAYQVDSSGMTSQITCRDKSKFMQESNKDFGFVYNDMTSAEAITSLAKGAGILNSKIETMLPYSKMILKDNPVAYWDFSALEDDKYAFVFDGATRLTSQRLFYMNKATRIASDTILPNAIEFWIRTGSETDQTIFNYATSSFVDEFSVILVGGYIGFVSQDTPTAVLDFAELGNDKGYLADSYWHFIFIERDAGDINVYKDGALIGTVTESVFDFGGTVGYITLGNAMTSWPSTFGTSFMDGDALLANVAILDGNFEDIIEKIPIDISRNGSKSYYGQEHGTLALFKLDEGTGTIAKSSKDFYNVLEVVGNENWLKEPLQTLKDRAGCSNATFVATPTYNVFNDGSFPIVSEDHRAITTTTGGAIALPNEILDITDELTIEAWVNGNTGGGPICCKGDADSTSYMFTVDGSLTITDGVETITTGFWGSVFGWQHYAVTVDRQYVKFYWDGQLINQQPTFTNAFVPNTAHLFIGEDNGSNIFAGDMASVAIYNKVLDQRTILLHKTSALMSKPKTFALLWNEDDVLWNSMLTIALADLGMFYFLEDDRFIYESARDYYDYLPDFNDSHINGIYYLDENNDIINGSQGIELMVNKVIVKVNPVQDISNTLTDIWSANTNESLAGTVLTSALDVNQTDIEFRTTVNEAGQIEPVFPANGFVRIGNEIIKYNSKTDFSLHIETRGMFGTQVNNYPAGEFVGEAREYVLEWSSTPIMFIKYPFITAQIFDGTVDVNLWTSNPTSGHLVISLMPSFDPDDIYQVLQGNNPVSGLDNAFVIAGVPANNRESKGTVTEVASDYANKIRRFGVKDMTIDNPFIQDPTYAKQIADFVLLHNSNPIKTISFGTLGLPFLQLGDLVVVQNFTQMSMFGGYFWIMSIGIEYDGGVSQTLSVKEYDFI